MSSPAKKRKLNGGSKSSAVQTKGLEYFFAKQKQASIPSSDTSESAIASKAAEGQNEPEPTEQLTDEEFARRLQAEWDKEALQANQKTIGTAEKLAENDETKELQKVGSDTPAGSSRDTIIAEAAPQSTPQAASSAAVLKKTLTLQANGVEDDVITLNLPLDQSPLTFNPSEYVADLQNHWSSEGGNASYSLLTRCFVLVSATQSRIKIVDTMVNCLRLIIEADPESLLPAVWLTTNSISPPYISLELGLGGSAISKALKQVGGLDNKALKAIYDKYGDAGDVAFEAKKKQSFRLRKPQPLTIKGVFQTLVKIAGSQGTGSAETKQRMVDKLLQDARGGEESRFIVRTLCQHLRIGAVKTTMLIALSRAFLLSKAPGSESVLRSPKELSRLKKEALAEVWGKAEEIVKACFAKQPNYNELIPALLEVGVTDELLARCDLKLHVPLRPMLGSITRDLTEMLTKLQGRDFACEFKYDGQRAQIHCDNNGKVSIFSRHLELMTDKYPDLVELVPQIRGEGVSSFILEGEVVAVDRNTGDLKTFQTLTNRARKDVAIGSITVDVCLFSFDLMYLNGQPLLDRPFRERRELLKSLFKEIPHHFTWVKSLDATSSDSELVLEFFKEAIETKCEGIMVKILDNLPTVPYAGGEDEAADGDGVDSLNVNATGTSATTPAPTKGKTKAKAKGKGKGKEEESGVEKKTRRKPLLATYEPDKRLDSWLKVKKDYGSSFDTIDLIPVAGWHGQGRKAKWWSPILLACRNDETGSLEVVCKCISGFTDAFYKANKEFYDNGEVSGEPRNVTFSKPAYIEYSGHPDVWFEPQEVWEMAFADITISPTYTAAIGLVDEDKGLSLRFPRFLKKRDDKSIEEASTNEFLAGLWRKQQSSTVPRADGDTARGVEEGDMDGDELAEE